MLPYFESILVVSVVCAVLCFLPPTLQLPLLLRTASLTDALTSYIFQMSLVAAVASSAPVIIDTIMDSYKLPRNFLYPKWLLLFSLTVPNTVMLIYNTNTSIFFCAMHAREIMLVLSLLSYLVSDKKGIRITRGACCLAACFAVSILLNNFNGYFDDTHIENSSLVLSFLALLGIFFLCGYKLYTLFHQKATDDCFRYTVVYTISLCFNLLGKWIVWVLTGSHGWSQTVAPQIAGYTFIDMTTVIFASTIPGRIARHEATLLQIKLEAKKNFVRYVSHEIRTPLNTVFLGLQVLTDRLNVKELKSQVGSEGRELCKDLKSACWVAIEMLNDLLLFDKIEEGQIVLEKRTVRFLPVLRETLSMFSVQAQAAGVILETPKVDDISPHLENAMIHVDVKKFSQIVRNIVSNALKFSPEGGVVTVRALLKPKPGSENLPDDDEKSTSSSVFDGAGSVLRLEVKDSGPGLTEEQQKQLFRDIVQFNAADLQGGGGSGLGMWISKAIIDKHGGNIGVESSGIPGEGSLFFVEVDTASFIDHGTSSVSLGFTPLSSHAPSEDDILELEMPRNGRLSSSESIVEKEITPQSSVNSSVTPLAPVLLGMTSAFVVDDSPLNRKMLRAMLKKDFVEVFEAVDGIDALEQYEARVKQGKNFDVIFMDDGMPRMKGRDAIKVLREELGYVGPILAVTGNMLTDDVEALHKAGANAVCEKPLDVGRMRSILQSYLANNNA